MRVKAREGGRQGNEGEREREKEGIVERGREREGKWRKGRDLLE